MKILIIDDELKAREVLEMLLVQHVSDIVEIRKAESGPVASDIMNSYHPDLVFLDIKMPMMNGFTWLNSLEKINFQLVFVTAFDQFAIKAIRFAAFDYLLKPIDNSELLDMFERLKTSRAFEDEKEQIDTLLHNSKQSDIENYRLALPTSEGVHYLKASQITRCEADGSYTKFYLSYGKSIITSKSIGTYEQMLSGLSFVRCHKSHIVNLHFCESLIASELKMTDRSLIPISRRRLSLVRNKLIKT